MKIIFSFLLILFSLTSFSQDVANGNKSTRSNTKSFVIGIGSSETTSFNEVLTYLKNDNNIDVYAVCEAHQIVGLKVLNNQYKSYDVLRDSIINEFVDIILLRKTDAIFTKDCSDEILKQ